MDMEKQNKTEHILLFVQEFLLHLPAEEGNPCLPLMGFRKGSMKWDQGEGTLELDKIILYLIFQSYRPEVTILLGRKQ